MYLLNKHSKLRFTRPPGVEAMLDYVRLIAYIGSCERDRPVVGKACFISFLENGRNIGGTLV